MNLHRASAFRIIRTAITKFFEDDMTTYAAALAYRVLLALFPFLIFLTSILGFLELGYFFDWMREQAAYMLPGQAMDEVNRVLAELETPRGGLMSFGIALALFSASAGVFGTMNALNVAYAVTERRPPVKRFLVSIAYTIGLAVVMITAAAIMVAGPRLLTWATRFIGLDAYFIALWAWVRWPIAVFLLMVVVAVVYWAAPNVKQPFRLITPGSVLAVIVWIAASVGFAFYVQNFADYNRTYGSIGAVIVLLFYFFLSAAVLLFGAELNAAIARGTGEKIEQAE